MAQILIKRRKHFAEDVKPTQWSDKKWAGRPLRGDIVEIRENGYWKILALGTGIHGWDLDAFALIQITNLNTATAQRYCDRYDDGTVFFKNRFRINLWESIPWIKNTFTIDGKQYEEWYYIRNNLGGAVSILDKVT